MRFKFVTPTHCRANTQPHAHNHGTVHSVLPSPHQLVKIKINLKEAAERRAENMRKQALARTRLLDRMVAEAKAWIAPGHVDEKVSEVCVCVCVCVLEMGF